MISSSWKASARRCSSATPARNDSTLAPVGFVFGSAMMPALIQIEPHRTFTYAPDLARRPVRSIRILPRADPLQLFRLCRHLSLAETNDPWPSHDRPTDQVIH